ncbi:MAG: hypothetical protein KAG53_12235, partial [Endozoicomonadaceae bacterium]|nr:hypothetical protein [Endozoicomonadaceae bacterium]
MADKENKQTGSESDNAPNKSIKTKVDDSQKHQEKEANKPTSEQSEKVPSEQKDLAGEKSSVKNDPDPTTINVDGVTYDRFGNKQVVDESAVSDGAEGSDDSVALEGAEESDESVVSEDAEESEELDDSDDSDD